MVLETLQFLTPDRNVRLIDLIPGAALGIAAGTAVRRLAPELGNLWRRGRSEQRPIAPAYFLSKADKKIRI